MATSTRTAAGTTETTAAASTARPHGLSERFRESPRLRLTPYFLLLALPLAVGIWAFGNYGADNARQRADSQLRSSLATAVAGYGNQVAAASQTARAIAQRPSIQRAVRTRHRRALAAFVALHPNVAFRAGRTTLAGRIQPGSATRSIHISTPTRTVGTVIVAVPLDRNLLQRLGRPIPPNQRLVGIDGGRVVAGPQRGERASGVSNRVGSLRLGDTPYRGAAVPIVRGGTAELGAVEPQRLLDAAQNRPRRRILLAGLAILAGVALVAYALAPAFARTRFAQSQRAQAAQVLSHVGDGIFLVEPEGTIGFWNPAAEALTGLTAAEALKRRPDEIFRRWRKNPPRATPPDERPVTTTGRYEVNGRELWLSMSGAESPNGTVYAFRDLTEEHRLEETRADFVATVSHELRTPLASIHGAAETLRTRDEQLRPGTRRELLEIVFEQSERLAHLVDQILLANQLSSGSAHVERRSFDASRATKDAVDGLRHALPGEVQLELHLPPADVEAVGDPDRVRQILVNLVENAGKYSPGGGRVDVALARVNGSVRFSVRDEGLGIPQGEQNRIFEKFYRLDASMSRGVGGSGLGLFICRELVELMDGRIWVTSEPGLGSTFSFDLPASAGG
jgi:PAS domain S-box-containing protein